MTVHKSKRFRYGSVGLLVSVLVVAVAILGNGQSVVSVL